MTDERLMTGYYKQKLYGGRRTAARTVDFIALRLILLLAGRFLLAERTASPVLAWFLSLLAVLFISVGLEMIKAPRLARFIRRERLRLAHESAAEQLMLVSPGEYRLLAAAFVRKNAADYSSGCLIVPIQKIAPLTEDDLIRVCRAARVRGCDSAAVFALSEPTEKAREILARYKSITVSFEGKKLLNALLQEPAFGITEDTVQQRILDGIRAEKEKRKALLAEPFRTGRARRYLLVAAGLFLMSFFVRYQLYYRLLAGACLSFSALSLWLSASRSKTG